MKLQTIRLNNFSQLGEALAGIDLGDFALLSAFADNLPHC